MLNDLLNEYSKILVSHSLAGMDSTSEVIKLLNKIDTELKQSKYKCYPSAIQNKTAAMLAFYSMFAFKIGGDRPSFLCYYFSSLVANDMALPVDSRVKGNLYRAFITFKNMKQWKMLMSIARTAPMSNYKGNLDEQSFFDLLLLSDVYKAWNADPDSSMLENLKKQAPYVASLHPSFSKEQVIAEGDLAHNAIFNVVKTLVEA